MIVYRATLDVPRELVWFAAKLLLAERRKRGTPRGSRAVSCFWQAVMGLRWFRDRTTADALPRDHSDSRATAYRYLDEVILVLAEQAPDLGRMLERAKDEEFSHVILDMSRSLPRRDPDMVGDLDRREVELVRVVTVIGFRVAQVFGFHVNEVIGFADAIGETASARSAEAPRLPAGPGPESWHRQPVARLFQCSVLHSAAYSRSVLRG